MLSTRTLSIVLKHQGASIHTLNFGQYTKDWRKAELARLTIGGLATLGIAELGTGRQWITDLLAKNYQTLRHLRLGSEVNIATEYASDGYIDSDELRRFADAEKFAKLMKDKVRALKEPSNPIVRLESLTLVGLNFLAFVGGLIEPFFDFGSLTVLKLESCAGLEAAFPLLVGGGAGRQKTKSALRLHTLAIRHENTSYDFSRNFEIFLLSLKPLAHLHVLLEGDYAEAVTMSKVLRIHGKCLQSFIWDERSGPRSDVQRNTTLHFVDHSNLGYVAKYCPGLKALGISLHWGDIAASEKNHKKVVPTLKCEFISMLISHRLLPHSPD